jgi:hypothetical protein
MARSRIRPRQKGIPHNVTKVRLIAMPPNTGSWPVLVDPNFPESSGWRLVKPNVPWAIRSFRLDNLLRGSRRCPISRPRVVLRIARPPAVKIRFVRLRAISL